MGISDKITDGIASAVSGKKVQTIVVSFDEILSRLETVLKEAEPDEIVKIEKVIKGSFWTSLKAYDCNNGKYRVSTLYAGTAGSSRLTNEISVMEIESGNVYTYKKFLFKGQIKKAGKNLISRYKK